LSEPLQVDRARHKAISKAMARVLRHEAGRLGLTLDAEGYAALDELAQTLNRQSRLRVTVEELRAVVAEGAPVKQRYSIVEDCVRANYGHSLAAIIQHPAGTPPALLYHGTSAARVEAILREGLRPMARQYVHLTPDAALARSVGRRHGAPELLAVDTVHAAAGGVVFYLANPQFWLCAAMPAEYLSKAG
jgi:putative RNA 2'-phosphotransferase